MTTPLNVCPEWTFFKLKTALLWSPEFDDTELVIIPDQIGTNWEADADHRFPVIRDMEVVPAELIMEQAEYDFWVNGDGECYVLLFLHFFVSRVDFFQAANFVKDSVLALRVVMRAVTMFRPLSVTW